jgi:hypothetical protein
VGQKDNAVGKGDKAMETLTELIENGELDGYQPGRPTPGIIDGASIDAEVCDKATCSNCGHRGMEYYPYVQPGSYRAFAVCPNCGEAEEF